jgi:type IX secretion system PorP/SprF family membrane protein
MNLVNPAYAGVDSITGVSSTLRKQWTGIANAPETQAISFGTSLGKKLGFGMTVINDQTFIEKQTFVSLDFSYKLKMSETADVYFGIKAGGSSYNVNTLGLETYNVQSDPALAAISTFNPNVGVGALYKEGPMYISLSIPRLLNTKKATNDAGYASVATDSPHIYLSGGYDVPLDGELSTFILKPSAMLRYVSGAPVSLDLTAMLQIDKIFELGGMYRTDKAYAAMATVVISKRLVFGFAYEMSARPELARARNTNEMLLQFRF